MGIIGKERVCQRVRQDILPEYEMPTEIDVELFVDQLANNKNIEIYE